MFSVKLFLYDSTKTDFRGAEFSASLMQGAEIKEDITSVLDTAEITVISTRKESFAPETKFIVDIYNDDVLLKTIDLCVAEDIVKKPILTDENYYEHHISFIEPSVIAQKRTVDNISVTYKLKDVSLAEKPIYNTSEQQQFDWEENIPNVKYNFGRTEEEGSVYVQFGKYFKFEGEPYLIKPDGSTSTLAYNDFDSFLDSTDGTHKAKLHIPKLAIYRGVGGTKNFAHSGYVSLEVKITEKDFNGNVTAETTKYVIENTAFASTTDVFGFPDSFGNGWLLENIEPIYVRDTNSYKLNYQLKKYSNTLNSAPTYETDFFVINKEKQYFVTIGIYDGNEIPPANITTALHSRYAGETPTSIVCWQARYPAYGVRYDNKELFLTNNSNIVGETPYTVFSEDGNKTILYSSSIPYTALDLLQKAIINSAIYEKKSGIYSADVNAMDLPFVIDQNFITRLSQVQVIENFYNQKNLWEIMLEVGNYIHAIPELRFAEDDKFEITFNLLGRTDEKQDNGTKVSIFNSRSVEDYITETNSYVENMVQIGGEIEEWVVPKTVSEDLLVTQDSACLILSKPIIEILEVEVRCDRQYGDIAVRSTADFTPFVYEKYVYDVLGIRYDVNPNRGIAMYYELGDNKILGGQYQLPQANANLYSDYAFKKCIYCAFNGVVYPSATEQSGYWEDLQVKDFSFRVRYRAKDTVRLSHIRPDLRKYLLNSKYDKFPIYRQFNNQQDILVDSAKFGLNMYGKLIKNGNNSYTVTEWHDDFYNLKHKGELYRINGELYYVAKVTNTWYSTYVLSTVDYSKDYNELSNIIGIPSEPRFAEIGERSTIRREVEISDLLLASTNAEDISGVGGEYYIKDLTHAKDLAFGNNSHYAKYALTAFKGDKNASPYTKASGETDNYKEVITPVNAYSSGTTLTYEWDMQDNFGAGDKVSKVLDNPYIEESNYGTLEAVRYTDKFGKAGLLDFFLLKDIEMPNRQYFAQSYIRNMPDSFITAKTADETHYFVGDFDIIATNAKNDTDFNGRGICLLKDCRESISVDYNLHFITASDQFVVSPFLFQQNKQNVQVVLLSEEVNKLSAGYVSQSAIIGAHIAQTPDEIFAFNVTIVPTEVTSEWNAGKTVLSSFKVDITSALASVDERHFSQQTGQAESAYPRVKAIAIVCDSDTLYTKKLVLARNIPSDLNKLRATAPWFFGVPNRNAIFKKQ